MQLKRCLFVVLITGAIPIMANPQDTTATSLAPKLFIDCDYCDIDFIRKEINFVNYVIDRKNSDIHVLITEQGTASGGDEVTLTFIGLDRFAARNDTLVYAIPQDATDDDIRNKMVKMLKMGLMRYLADTPLADEISISYAKSSGAVVKKDNWNNWVFRISLSTYVNGQKSMKDQSFSGSVSASRITEEWKIRIKANMYYWENLFECDDATIRSISKSKNLETLIVRSISNHWSIGLSGGIHSSSYSNLKTSYDFAPAVEYNIFPYSESTRREFRLLYTLGYGYTYYYEETVYDKFEEGLLRGSLECVLELKQPWGTIETALMGSHYFHDFSKNNISLYSQLSLRLFKGFSLSLYCGFSMIHDQLGLPNRGATKEEVLLSRRELETQYSYYGRIGFEYTFGSIYSNIVNPRFGY
jgi:hypothetical protein